MRSPEPKMELAQQMKDLERCGRIAGERSDIDGFDARMSGPGGEVRAKLREPDLVSPGANFEGAVGEVAHAATHTEPARPLQDEVAEADALYFSPHDVAA